MASERFRIDDDLDAIQEWYRSRGLTDGLPIIPPTEARVKRLLDECGRDPGEVLGQVPPRQAIVDVESAAINAVMAGCPPKAFRVVLAAIQAALKPEFNLTSVQTSTCPKSIMLIVSGPGAAKAGITGGYGVMGPCGSASNLSVGRAVNLCLVNVGGAQPGVGSKIAQGNPAKVSFCVTENTEDSPWEHYHVRQGYKPNDTVVTLLSCTGARNVNDHDSESANRFLGVLSSELMPLGQQSWYISNMMGRQGHCAILLAPEHARLFGIERWSVRDLQQYLYEKVTHTVAEIRDGAMWLHRDWPPEVEALIGDSAAKIHLVSDPEDIHILVAGKAGKQSTFVPGAATTAVVTEIVRH